MSLSVGQRLGPYEILASIGAGGMGEVFKANDTRLNRLVALKVSKEEFSNRFEREARTVASLNHPNICQLYDVGPNYLVMEYVEGTPLKAPLPLNETLKVAAQICDALDAAHRKNITHRDLKPANILITRAGQVKLLDFGLAKIPETVTENDATRTLPLTRAGMIVGTLPYMAPEQLEAKEVDARTDIFAFGIVLYELISGRRPFEGDNSARLIGEILHKEISPVKPDLLDRMIRRCLARDPDERWQSVRDLKEVLAMFDGPTAAPVLSTPLLWPIAAALFALVAAALGLLHFRTSEPDRHVVKFLLQPSEKFMFSRIAVSPDGRRLAFTATGSGKTQLWVRSLDSLSEQPLAGAENASFPFWSPDSRFIAFFSEGRLKKIEASGGPPQTLADAANGGRGGAWSKDGVILFSSGQSTRFVRMSSEGGAATPVTSLDSAQGQLSHRWPAFLPDGRHFLYTVGASDPNVAGIYLGSLDSKDTLRLLGEYSSSAYISSPSGNGHILFWRSGTLMAHAYDVAKLRLTGEPIPVAEHVGYSSVVGLAAFSVSENGVLVYDSSGGWTVGQNDKLTWFDRTGKPLGTVDEPGMHYQPWLSPDEKQVAVDRLDRQSSAPDVWLFEFARGISTRFTFHPKSDWYPVWAPDNSRIVFASDREGVSNLYVKLVSGTGKDELLLKSANSKWPSDWSVDGRFLLFNEFDRKTNWNVWVLPLWGDAKAIPFLRTEFNEWKGVMSPDGKWIAYESDESGKYEVYVQPFPASSAKWQVSRGGGTIPRYRRDGKELYYLGADNRMMAVKVRAGATFQTDIPESLFDTRITNPFVRYAVSRDGQRFLIPTPLGETASSAATVVLNWTAMLKR